MIEFYVAHSRVDRRRILAVHDPRRQQIGVKRQPRQRVAALSIPELQRRGRLTQDVIPFGRWLVRLLDVLGEIAVPHERVRIVGAARRQAKLAERVPRLLSEHIGVVLGMHPIERARPQREREREGDADNHGDERRPRHPRPQARAFAGGSDHFRRRRLARQRGRERVAREPPRRRSAGRPLPGIRFEAPKDCPLDCRIHCADRGRGRGDRT